VTTRDRVPTRHPRATFRIRLIMERGMMRQRISPGSASLARGTGMDVEMTPGMALEDVWI
jgi:hypothetical protein